MHRTIAIGTQWVGRLTVIVALVFLIWNFADIAGSNDNFFAGPNSTSAYLSILASSASLAVSGMFAVALGMMLERFSDE